MDEIRTVHQCLFCPQTFGSASKKDDHILQHFAHETCIECDQNLIRIGSDLYTRHNAVTCIKVNFVKSEELAEKEYEHAKSPTSQEICNDGEFAADYSSLNPIFIEEMELKPDDLNEQLMLRANCDSEHEPHENHIEPNSNQFTDSMGVSESTSNQSSETDDRTKCNICNKILSTKNALKTHKLRTHSAPGHFPCQLCNMILTRKDSLRKHMKMQHDPNCVKFKCFYCYAVFLKKSSLENHHPKCKKRAEKLRNEDCSTTVEAVNTIHIKEEQIDDDYENTICTETVGMGPAQQNEYNSIETHSRENVRQPNGNDNKCDICLKTFFDKNTVRRHKVLVHGETSGTQECSKCKIKFFSAKGLANHELKCTTYFAECLECKVCKMMFETKSSLTRHITHAHSEVKKFRCTICGCISTDKVTFENHKCGRNLTNPTESAMNRQKTTGKYVCEMCGKKLRTPDGFQQHQIRFHSDEGTHFCGCMNIFSTAEALAEHNSKCEFRKKSRFPLIHLGKTFECHLCHRVLKEVDSLRRHMRQIHLPYKKKYECDTCGHLCSFPSELRNHNESVHLKFRKFLCTICGKSYTFECDLRYHMNKHTGETPFKCKHCDKAFSNPKSRNLHAMIHAVERNFKCPIEGCDKRFKTPANVHQHKRKTHGYNKKKQQL